MKAFHCILLANNCSRSLRLIEVKGIYTRGAYLCRPVTSLFISSTVSSAATVYGIYIVDVRLPNSALSVNYSVSTPLCESWFMFSRVKIFFGTPSRHHTHFDISYSVFQCYNKISLLHGDPLDNISQCLMSAQIVHHWRGTVVCSHSSSNVRNLITNLATFSHI